jgi:uncharacterized protein (DUF302 family)
MRTLVALRGRQTVASVGRKPAGLRPSDKRLGFPDPRYRKLIMNTSQSDTTTKTSPWPVAETVRRLLETFDARGVKVFATIDQAEAARDAGLELRDTVLIIFGNPAAGTPVMEAVPLAALELPLKLLVWDESGQTQVSYLTPAVLSARWALSETLAAPLAAIDGLTDAALRIS